MVDHYGNIANTKLVILLLSVYDLEEWGIEETFAMSMRYDFLDEEGEVVKVALKPERVRHIGLP